MLFVWDWPRFLLHLPLGVITPLLALTHPKWGIVFAVLFLGTCLLYQLVENWRDAYIDIQGIIAGIPLGALLVYSIGLLGG